MVDTLEIRAWETKPFHTDAEIIGIIPEALKKDKTAVDYILETVHTREAHKHGRKLSHHYLANKGSTPEQLLSYEIVQKMRKSGVRESHISYISKTLSRGDIEIALKNSMISPKQYVNLARIRYMDRDQLSSYSIEYDPRQEHMKDLHAMTTLWTRMEKEILTWNLGCKYHRPPTEKEIETELMEEILRTGGSYSKNCRAFCVLSHPDWFVKKEQ